MGRVYVAANGRTIGVQGIARTTDVLRALEAEPGGLSLANVAQRIELPRSTVHRIVTALKAGSLVVPASHAGRVVAALSIPVPTARFAGQEERLAEMLLRTCAQVSATLDGNGHPRC